MNAKYALALILALQVSMSLCEVPPPSQELVDKYDTMKATFYKRLLNLYGKLQAATAPLVQTAGEYHWVQTVKEGIEGMQTKPEFQAVTKVATGMAEEASPLVDKARTSVLGLYEQYLRSLIGECLDNAINVIKVHLDEFMPAE